MKSEIARKQPTRAGLELPTRLHTSSAQPAELSNRCSRVGQLLGPPSIAAPLQCVLDPLLREDCSHQK